MRGRGDGGERANPPSIYSCRACTGTALAKALDEVCLGRIDSCLL